jgi:hypothetical protein
MVLLQMRGGARERQGGRGGARAAPRLKRRGEKGRRGGGLGLGERRTGQKQGGAGVTANVRPEPDGIGPGMADAGGARAGTGDGGSGGKKIGEGRRQQVGHTAQ